MSKLFRKSGYTEKLADPRWQKKRLEILERDEWSCRWCGDSKSELHVHHLVYRKGLQPWDVKNGDLLTLCRTCHEVEAPKRQAAALYLVASILRERDIYVEDIGLLAEAVDGLIENGMFNASQVADLLNVNTYEDTWRYAHERDEKEWAEISEYLKSREQAKTGQIQTGGIVHAVATS